MGALNPMLPVSLVMGQSASAKSLNLVNEIKCLQPGRSWKTPKNKVVLGFANFWMVFYDFLTLVFMLFAFHFVGWVGATLLAGG